MRPEIADALAQDWARRAASRREREQEKRNREEQLRDAA